MEEEKKEPEKEYVSYKDRLEAAVADEKKKIFEKRKQLNAASMMNEEEERFAKAIISLAQLPEFKVFLEFETRELSDRLVRGLETPSETIFPVKDYACQMAFNRGRQFQMAYWRKAREQIVSAYVSKMKKIQEEQNGQS